MPYGSRSRDRILAAVILAGLAAAVALLATACKRPTRTAAPPSPASNQKAVAAPVAKLDLGLDIPLEFIRPGSFETDSGDSDGGIRQVRIPGGLLIGRYEITQAQWRAVMQTDPSAFKGDDRPVDSVSYDEAMEFCRRLSARSGRVVRLPTPDEWEYCCRAGSDQAYSFGPTPSTTQATFSWELQWTNRREPIRSSQSDPVGRHQPNAWNLYDMHGNVSEWCLDAQAPAVSSTPSRDRPTHVARGGSWLMGASDMRSASRNILAADARCNFVGFRIVIECPPSLAPAAAPAASPEAPPATSAHPQYRSTTPGK